MFWSVKCKHAFLFQSSFEQAENHHPCLTASSCWARLCTGSSEHGRELNCLCTSDLHSVNCESTFVSVEAEILWVGRETDGETILLTRLLYLKHNQRCSRQIRLKCDRNVDILCQTFGQLNTRNYSTSKLKMCYNYFIPFIFDSQSNVVLTALCSWYSLSRPRPINSARLSLASCSTWCQLKGNTFSNFKK